jgi:hypothetical protein
MNKVISHLYYIYITSPLLKKYCLCIDKVTLFGKFYLYLRLKIDIEGRLRTRLYDKRDDFNFPIVNFPFIRSTIPAFQQHLHNKTILMNKVISHLYYIYITSPLLKKRLGYKLFAINFYFSSSQYYRTLCKTLAILLPLHLICFIIRLYSCNSNRLSLIFRKDDIDLPNCYFS